MYDRREMLSASADTDQMRAYLRHRWEQSDAEAKADLLDTLAQSPADAAADLAASDPGLTEFLLIAAIVGLRSAVCDL